MQGFYPTGSAPTGYSDPAVTSSSVFSDLACSYAVRARVVADITCTYAVLSDIGAPPLSPVFADLLCTYSVRAAISRDMSCAYGVRSAVSRDLVCTYQVEGSQIIEINARNILRAGKGGGDFRLKSGGRWTIGKDPDDEMFYAVNLVDVLPAGVTVATAPTAPEAIVAGVESLSDVYIQDSLLIVKLGGLVLGDDIAPESNACTFRFYLSNTERCDRTIYFTREDK